jgi:hypothetical protein
VRDTVAAPDERMVRAARQLVEERFDWSVIGRGFAGLVAEVLDPAGAARHG